MPQTVAEILSGRKLRSYTHRYYKDPELYDAVVAAKEAYGAHMDFTGLTPAEVLARKSEASPLAEALVTAKEALRPTVALFTFMTMTSKKDFEDLLEDHPPTEEQIARAAVLDRIVEFNIKTFPVALVEACSAEPKMDADGASLFLDSMSDLDESELFWNVFMLNRARHVDVLGKD